MIKTLEKIDKLRDILRRMESVLISFSGGVDSTFLSAEAHDILGEKALSVFACSPIFPRQDLKLSKNIADLIHLRFRYIDFNEMQNPDFVANTDKRCYHCKLKLYEKLKILAAEEQLNWVADGTIFDDLSDYRPGLSACRELGIRSPLLEAGLTKDELRQLSREKGLPNWNKPSSPCLVSRIPYGITITQDILNKIDAGESYLHGLGFNQLRLRHHGDIARIEVDLGDISLLLSEQTRKNILSEIKKLGYSFVTIDLEGYNTGSMNANIKQLME